MSKFTPGPYIATAETYPSISGQITISSVTTEDCIAVIPLDWKNRKANAALLAAAPEMYKALRIAEKFIEEELGVRKSSFLPGKSPYIDEAVTALKLISSAIADAEKVAL